MKIAAQEKIAELERRINELENLCEEHFGVAFYKTGVRPPIKTRKSWWADSSFAKVCDVFFNGRPA
jgi:hypothetical protein